MEVNQQMAALAEEYQITHGAIGLVSINVVNGTNEGVAASAFDLHRQIGALLECHPTLFTAVIRPLSDSCLDQSPFPQVGVIPEGFKVVAAHSILTFILNSHFWSENQILILTFYLTIPRPLFCLVSHSEPYRTSHSHSRCPPARAKRQ
jgi:hypothetical protein